MTEMKFKELHDAIEAELIKEHGVAFLALSKHKRCAMICDKYLEIMKEMRERQE